MHDGRNYYVITGGPGSGKTTVIEALAARGYRTVAESGRAITRQQVAIGGKAVHWADRTTYLELMLSRGMEDHERMAGEDGPVFFDRGVAELVGYCRLIGMPVPDHVRNAARLYRYNGVVFVTPPWPEIYVNDAERKQDMAEAVHSCELAVATYRECGYRTVALPKAPVAERVACVLDGIGANASAG